MTYTQPFTAPTYRKTWPAPAASSGKLGTVHLVGDVQTYWEIVWPSLRPTTVYDAVGFDIRDRLHLLDKPDVTIQVGDCSDYEAPDLATLLKRFSLARDWVKYYDLGQGNPVHWVMGNHDQVGYANKPPMITAQGWADAWGYPGPSYPIDCGTYRLLVLGPTGTGTEMTPLATGGVPVRPMTDADLNWLDAQLTADHRPTLLVNHAPIFGMDTYDNATDRNWRSGQSTVSGGMAAADLIAIINEHSHVAAWLHGHTHSKWNAAPNNVSLFNTGSRNIAVVDASCVFQRPRFNDRVPGVTFYVDFMDDGKTLNVRWRDHEKSLWSTPDGTKRVWTEITS